MNPIWVTYTDHDNVLRDISFSTRREYKDWRIENQKRKKAALGTSDFRIHQGFLDSNTKAQDLADTLAALRNKQSQNMTDSDKEDRLMKALFGEKRSSVPSNRLGGRSCADSRRLMAETASRG